MRIFYICYEDLSVQAAWMIHIREITENLKKLGHDVVLFAPNSGKLQYKTTVPVVYVPFINIRLIKEYSYYLFLVPYILKCYWKKKPNLLYGREMALCIIPFILSRLFGVPSFVEINGLIPADYATLNASKWKQSLYELFQKINVHLADKVIVPDESIKNGVINLYNVALDKVNIVEVGGNIEKFQPLDKSECRQKLNLQQNNLYILFIGRFYAHHGIQEFIKIIFPHIIKEDNSIKLLLVGDGGLRTETEELVANLGLQSSITFTGETSHDLIPLYVNAADTGLVFLTGEYEKGESPTKLYEYWASSCPIITNMRTGIAKVVEKFDNGIVIDFDAPVKSANAITELLKDSGLKDKLGKNGRQYVITHRTWKRSAQMIEDIYQDGKL